MQDEASLPRWQLDSIYPELGGEAYLADRAAAERDIGRFESLLDAHDVRRGGRREEAVTVVETALPLLEQVLARVGTLHAYLSGFVSVDADHEKAQADLSGLAPLETRLDAAVARWTGWLGEQDVEAILEGSPAAASHPYWVRRQARQARHLMGDEAEALAAALDDSGGSAWGRLHARLTATATVDDEIPGRGSEPRNLASLKTLQSDPVREVREAAWRAELNLLDRNARAFAAALNGVKGQVGEVAHRRGYASALDLALDESRIERPSLDAMQQAVRETFPDMRRYLHAKARLLGLERLGWFDVTAPVGETAHVSWTNATERVLEQFDAFDPRLGDLARRSLAEAWIDVPPRPGKRSGAFCMPVLGRAESRVMLNFGGHLTDVFTLAHELGHAYHNACLFDAGRDALDADLPMTVAETASTFCEALLVTAALERLEGEQRLALLEHDLQRASMLLIDIDSRFRFERTVFERRAERELSLSELDAAMLDAQDQTYGAVLDAELRHPRMWAQKPHYYSSGRSFYNFPYTFGYLFGAGLLEAFRARPEGFADRYRALLADTGRASPADLAARFDIDISTPAFWRSALRPVGARVRAFEDLVEERT